MEFKILKFKRIRDKVYQVDGVLNVNRMFTTKIESFGNSSSFEVFKEIAKLSDLGFSTNITNTDDTMTWINPGKRVIEFCREVLSKSYRSDLSYMWAFVDFYYNINFIDIESQMNFDISKELGLLTADLSEMQNKINTENTSDATSMYLTNDQSAISSSAYFESYRIFNNSTIKSIEKGYATKIKYYDWQSKDFLIFNVDSITDENLILKADDKEFLDENVTLTWEGKQVNDNVHENFHYSTVQNDINLNELQKIGMEIILPTPNFNLYKFQKIFVLLINQGMREINPLVNHKLSGEWIISEVHFLYDKGAFKQKVKLLRRSLGFSQEETSDE